MCIRDRLLTGCQGKLSDKFDEEEVKNAAKDIVTQVNEGNVESCLLYTSRCV